MASFTFFGIQIAYRRYRDDTSRGRLHHIIAGADEDQTLPDKRAFWKNVVALVKGNLPHFEYGYWDFIRGGKAEGEFETWSSEIEAGLATETEEVGAAADEVHRLGGAIGDARYVVVSLLFLVDEGTNTDQTLGERCDVAEADFFQRATFVRLLDSVTLMNFVNVRADAVYVAPGSDKDGVSELELREGWPHLKPIER